MVEECWFKESIEKDSMACLECKRRKNVDFILLDGHEDRDLIRFLKGFYYALLLLRKTQLNSKTLMALEIRVLCDIDRGLGIKQFEKYIVTKETDLDY